MSADPKEAKRKRETISKLKAENKRLVLFYDKQIQAQREYVRYAIEGAEKKRFYSSFCYLAVQFNLSYWPYYDVKTGGIFADAPKAPKWWEFWK